MTDFIATEIFRTPPSAYLKYVLNRWLGRYWWIIVIPMAICCAMSFYDIRWIFVAFMILCIAVPFIIANLYLYHLLSPAAQRAVKLKNIIIRPYKEISITYHTDSDDNKEESTDTNTKQEIIEWNNIHSIKPFSTYFVIEAFDGDKSIIIVPYNVLKVNTKDIEKLNFFT